MSYAIYEDHLCGGLFIADNYEPEACDQCGDIDVFIGYFDNVNDLEEGLKDSDGWTGYDRSYLESIFEE